MVCAQLSQAESYQIHALISAIQTQAAIAQILGLHKSTISRELMRGSGQHRYRPSQTQRLCDERSRGSRNSASISPEIWYIAETAHSLVYVVIVS